MAHSKQAQKRIRRTAQQTEVNSQRRSRIRTFVKKAEVAIAAGDKTSIPAAFKAAMSELQRGVTKGVVNKRAAGRKISRLAARIKKLAS